MNALRFYMYCIKSKIKEENRLKHYIFFKDRQIRLHSESGRENLDSSGQGLPEI